VNINFWIAGLIKQYFLIQYSKYILVKDILCRRDFHWWMKKIQVKLLSFPEEKAENLGAICLVLGMGQIQRTTL